MKIGDTVSFSRIYKPSKIAKIFKTRFVTESGIRVGLEKMQVIDGATGPWKITAYAAVAETANCIKCQCEFKRRDTIGSNGYYFCKPCELGAVNKLSADLTKIVGTVAKEIQIEG